MAVKIYTSGNYLFFKDGNNIEIPDHKSLVNIFPIDLTDSSEKYIIESPKIGKHEVELSDLIDELDVSYTLNTWTDFYTTNTGFETALGGTRAINKKSDFPKPVDGVILLDENLTYIIETSIDLTGDRLETIGIVNLFGTSSETSFLTSTGLNVGVPLFTSIHTCVLENITFHDVDTCLSINGNTNSIALDWENVNFENIPNVGLINSCENFIFETGAFLSSKNLKLTGEIGTIGISNSLFVSDSLTGNIIELDESCIITRRFRIIYSSFVVNGLSTGINVDELATVPTESYILDTVNFAGNGTYISGINQSSNNSFFSNCKGISNTAVNGQLYMQSNVTATTIAETSTFVKVSGTTSASVDNSKISHSNNRLTIDAVISRKYLIQCNLSFASGNNNECEFGFFDSQIEGIRTPSKTKSTANSSGRAENISFACVVTASDGDYFEIWCANNTANNNITVTDMNFIITEIK